MKTIVLAQLPIPQLNYGRFTGNIPLAAACLKQAAGDTPHCRIEILPERVASYLGDAALIERILRMAPDILGFTVFCWNVERTLFIAEAVKARRDVRIILGGPEVTPDNPKVAGDIVDFRVYGEGEAVFAELLAGMARNADGMGKAEGGWTKKSASKPADAVFARMRSPYVAGLLEPELEKLMMVETQRGCPYHCAYCYYGKSRKGVCAAPNGTVLEAIQWAYDNRLDEVFLLDPSLNARPRLREMLRAIRAVNKDRRLTLMSEIRAEAIDAELAALLADAGFTEFEIGLQSTNPEALRKINRPADLDRFLAGVMHLKAAGIRAKIDLILGLPGDTPYGFRRSVDFMVENDLHGDAQLFFLSLLPGTELRGRAEALGLRYQSAPPYTVLETPAFSPTAMRNAFEYAEEAFDLDLQPGPEIDLAFRNRDVGPAIPAWGLPLRADGEPYIAKVILSSALPDTRLRDIARRLAHPYQVFLMPELENPDFAGRALATFTAANPHTPLEIVLMEPTACLRPKALETALKLHRPLYLDRDLPALGSRSVLMTLVSASERFRFEGIMRRQVFWWRKERLPRASELTDFLHLDGVLIDCPAGANWRAWQDETAPKAEDVPSVSFSEASAQRRWMRMTAPNEFFDSGAGDTSNPSRSRTG